MFLQQNSLSFFSTIRFPNATIKLGNAKVIMSKAKNQLRNDVIPTNFAELCDGFAKNNSIFRGVLKIESNAVCLILATNETIGHLKEITEIFVSFDMEVC